ncbi:hypothetical protein EV379_3110 [Microterricola gilva]|uniref:Uncharacterized protein n=1 Tax=Microterricola gilva TaxID=393267 RepID=A0A4Q8APZ3_9MICO|nr:hypothetical protein [Microterricola gilva]RZU66744.1 hypothetical protein EV379_3110 [Microterricola gilva]
MIQQTENTTTHTTIRYTAPAADTSQMVAEVENGVATFTVSGTTQVVPVESLPAYLALVAAVQAAVIPTPTPAPNPALEQQ